MKGRELGRGGVVGMGGGVGEGGTAGPSDGLAKNGLMAERFGVVGGDGAGTAAACTGDTAASTVVPAIDDEVDVLSGAGP